MMSLRSIALLVILSGSSLLCPSPVSAQVLLWGKLPPDGSWVRFEGTYQNTNILPDSNDGNLELKWRRELTVKSVGQEMAEYNGQETPCRWLEFKTVTGKESEEGLQPGEFGVRIYKVLVPESRVIGKLVDADGIPANFIPIIKGYRKLASNEPEPLTEKLLSFSPMITLLTYYPNLKPESDQAAELQLPTATVQAKLWTGDEKLESRVNRSTNEGRLWLTEEVPFGLAKFQVKIVRESKDGAAAAEAFKPSAELHVDMTLVATGKDATSELPAQK